MKLVNIKVLVYSLFAVVLMAGCSKEYETIEQLDEQSIQSYISKNNLSVQQYNNTGIYYEVIKTGTGEDLDFSKKCAAILTVKSINSNFAASDTITAFNRFYDYFGYFGLRGTSKSEAVPQLIKFAMVKKGGSVRMLIPSRLAYGRNPVSNSGYLSSEIPGNSCLEVIVTVLEDSKQASYDDQSIKKYMTANGLTGFSKTDLGVYYQVNSVGTGDTIFTTSNITVNYTGKLMNNAIFDQSTSSTVTFSLADLIPGWQQVLPMIRGGGSVKMIIPSKQAYGFPDNINSLGQVAIPAFSCLYFEVKVTEVSND